MKIKPVFYALSGIMVGVGILSTGSAYAGYTTTTAWTSSVSAMAMPTVLPLQLNPISLTMKLPVAPHHDPHHKKTGQGGKNQKPGNNPGTSGPGKNLKLAPGSSGSKPPAGNGPLNGLASSNLGNGPAPGPGKAGKKSGPGNNNVSTNPGSNGPSKGSSQNGPGSGKGSKKPPPKPAPPIPVSLTGTSIGQITNLSGQPEAISMSISGLNGYQLGTTHVSLMPGLTLPLVLNGPELKSPGTYTVVITVTLGGFTESRSTVISIKAPQAPKGPKPPKPPNPPNLKKK